MARESTPGDKRRHGHLTPVDGSGKALRRALEVLAGATEGAREAYVLVDASGTSHLVNGGKPLAALFDETPAHMLSNPRAFVAPADIQRVLDTYEQVLRDSERTRQLTLDVLGKGGRMVSLRATLTNRLHEPAIGAVVVRVAPAGTAEALDAADATEDAAGGELPSKAAFMAHLDAAVRLKEEKIWQLARFARAVVRDQRYNYTLLLLELERFRMLLGGYGQGVLNELVEQVLKRITAVLRGRDVVAHLGGGEFSILLHQVGHVERAVRVADAVMTVLEERFDVQGQPIRVKPIIGIATSERRYLTGEDVVRDASAAMSRAHRVRGRRREAFRTNIRIEDKQRIGLMADMHDCIGTEAFYLAYQPIVRLEDESLAGFEALCRWQHPRHGAIGPDKFIPLAEESGLIHTIGRWVLEQACLDMAQWNLRLPEPLRLAMSVNVSTHQLTDRLVREVEQVLEQSGLEPRHLCLEITESAVLDNVELVSGVIGRLKKLGVTFSLDDFGTGYSSLSYLRMLPYDSLKIDRSFLTPGNASGEVFENLAIVSAVVSLGRSLRMDVVAEGVETVEQVALLRELGCPYAQGYHFSKPVPREAAAAMVAAHGGLTPNAAPRG